MAKQLNDEQQRFVVELLACFRSPSEVAAALKAEHKVSISRQAVEKYDPTKQAGANLVEPLRHLFDESRKTYLAKVDGVGIVHQKYRLERLHEMEVEARESGNLVLAAQLHEQAAKELGGSFTNKKEVTGRDGKDLIPPTLNIIIESEPQAPSEAG